MAVSINRVNAVSDTFQGWVNKTNDVIDVISASAITSNLSSIHAETVGNSYLRGIFGANNVFVVDGLRGGNSSVSNTLSINSASFFTSNANFGNDFVIFPGNTSIGPAIYIYGEKKSFITSTILANTDGSSAVLVDIFANNQWSAIEYSVTMKDKSGGTANATTFTKLAVLTDDYDTFLTEYATMVTNSSAGSNGVLGSFSTTIGIVGSVATVNVYFTPHSSVANCRLSITRNGVVATP